MLNEVEAREKEAFNPSTEERDFIMKHYKGLQDSKLKKEEAKKRLGWVNLLEFWRISKDNYDVITPIKESGDWKRPAKRGITRDKANAFIAKLTKRIISPQILAQNSNQEIDLKVSRALRVLVEYVERKTKSVRVFIKAVHKCVIEGTVHVQIDMVNGQEVKTVLRNEECFPANEYQSDVQKQPYFHRAFIANYEEMKLEWGDNPMWKHVYPGTSDKWGIEDEYFNIYNSGIASSDDVMMLYAWEHTGYYKDGPQIGKPKPKKFNIFIDGIPMLPVDNTLNLKHNRFNLAKTVFEMFSDSDYYWGNSLPNKIRHDQSYLDAFRTIALNKAILNLLPPLFNKGKEHIDQDVIVPAKITTTENEVGDLFEVPGVNKPLTQGDWNVEERVERSVDEATQPPISIGQDSGQGQTTLGEIQLKDARAAELMEIFGRMIGFLVEDMGEQTVSNTIQFETKRGAQAKLNDESTELLYGKTVDVSDQTLTGGASKGETGVMSLRFGSKHPDPLAILQEEMDAKKSGNKVQIIHMNVDYLNNLDTYVFVEANPGTKPSEQLERLTTNDNYHTTYKGNAMIDQKEALRNVIRANNDDESKLLIDQPMQAPQGQPAGPAGGGMGTKLRQSAGQQAKNLQPAV